MNWAVPEGLADGVLADGVATHISQLSEAIFGPQCKSRENVQNIDFHCLDPRYVPTLRTGDRWVHIDHPELSYPDYRDERNYVFLNPAEFDTLVETLNAHALSHPDVPILLAFFTGGTLSMVTGEGGILKPAHDGESLLSFAGHDLQRRAMLGLVRTPKIDSADMKVMLISEIIGAYHNIARRLSPEARALFAGVVLGHGTDTAAATGAATRVMHTAHDVSNGLVAAQRSADDPLPDGPSNIAATISGLIEMWKQNTAHLFAHSGGAFLGEFLGQGWFEKVTDRGLKIFESSGYPVILKLGLNSLAGGILGGVNNRRSDSNHAPVWLDGYSPVRFFSTGQNDDPLQLLKDIIDSDSSFSVIRSFGAGTMAQSTIRALIFADVLLAKKAERTGTPRKQIMINTLFSDAEMEHDYKSNEILRRAGLVMLCAPDDMIVAKAMFARTLSPDPETQKRIILTPINNEFPLHYVAYARKYYESLLLSDSEQRKLFTAFRLTKVA